MTITVPLTQEEEIKLVAIAGKRGVSVDAFIKEAVKELLDKSLLAAASEIKSEDQEKQIEKLFETFDSLDVQTGISEEAFHRDNWYR